MYSNNTVIGYDWWSTCSRNQSICRRRMAPDWPLQSSTSWSWQSSLLLSEAPPIATACCLFLEWHSWPNQWILWSKGVKLSIQISKRFQHFQRNPGIVSLRFQKAAQLGLITLGPPFTGVFNAPNHRWTGPVPRKSAFSLANGKDML